MRFALKASGLLLAMLVTAPADPAMAQDWRIDEAASTLSFTFRQMGSAVRGAFEDFTAEIAFDPEALAEASVTAEIRVDSVTTGNAERDQAILGADWFDAANHPTATFTSTGFSHAGGDDYVVTGELAIRGVSETVELPMSISIDGTSATAAGTLEIDRRAFGIGQGEWASDAAIGHGVTVEIAIEATAAE